LYNITLASTDPTQVAEIRFYNNSVRIANQSNAIFDNNTSQGFSNTVTCSFQPATDGDYYAIVCDSNLSSTFSYSIFYAVCPRGVTLLTPYNSQYLSTNTVNLTWQESAWDTGHVASYELQIDTSGAFNPGDQYFSDIILQGESSTSHVYVAPTSAWFYWRVRATDLSGNVGIWSSVFSFGVDTSPPSAPVLQALAIYYSTGNFLLNWSIPSDGQFTVQYYNVYMSTSASVSASPSLRISPGSTQVKNFMTTPNLAPGYYYFRVSAVGHSGFESLLSNEVGTVVLFQVSGGNAGRYFDSRQQNFTVQPGDILEYEVANVISPTLTATGQANFTYGYGNWATSFVDGNLFNFWVQSVDRSQVIPVTGDFYAQIAVSLGFQLLTTDYPLIPFVAAGNSAYMEAVAESYVATALTNPNFNSQINYTGTAQYGFNQVSTFDIVFNTNYIDQNNNHQTMEASFVYDASTGVLLQLTVYNSVTGVGYTLNLVETSVPLTISWQTWTPIIFVAGILVFAGIVYVIIKKVQYR
jgi:hypothetical protein